MEPNHSVTNSVLTKVMQNGEQRLDEFETYYFEVEAADGTSFIMTVIAADSEGASNLVGRYPGIVRFEPINHTKKLDSEQKGRAG